MNTILKLITIDGPSGAGKGYLAACLAEALGWHRLDSGSLYRGLVLAATARNIAFDQEEALASLALQVPIAFQTDKLGRVEVVLDDRVVTQVVKSERIGAAASEIAVLPKVRSALLARQRAFLGAPGLIADGRDMGTVVFPDAPLKFFLYATVKIRAARRVEQLQTLNLDVTLSEILSDIKQRDSRDCSRTCSPLVAAADAIIIDSTNLSRCAVFEKSFQYVRTRFAFPSAE